MTTEQKIQYCINELDNNPSQDYSLLHEDGYDGEVVIVYRADSCMGGGQYYEIKVCALREATWRYKREQ